jgi:quinohemoprotein ethanol dehydrogenase
MTGIGTPLGSPLGAAGTGAAVLFLASALSLGAEPQAADWPAFGASESNQHYSPLSSINAGNVARLGLAWSFDIPGVVLATSTPVEADGTLYFASGYSVIRAVDAASGALRWSYDPQVARVAGQKIRKGWGIRGIAYAHAKVFTGTQDGRLLALDAGSGKLLWSVMTIGPKDERYITGPPLTFKDKVLIGHAGADVGPVRGYVTAYDAATGKEAWRFYTVPGDPKKGFENDAMRMAARTWHGEWWKYGGGGTAWNSMAFDAEMNRVYIGTGNGAPWNQKIRSPGGGDNLFLCSIVALDADTGRYLWHYQVNPGETWDYTAVMDIELATLAIDGKPRRVLMEAPKNGFYYVIDRDTGKLISAEKFVKVTWADRIDRVTGRPVEAANARYQTGETTIWPGGAGGHNWQPMSFNPMTHLAYIPAIEMPGNYNDKGIDLKHWKPEPGMVPNIGVNFGLADDVPPNAGSGSLLAWDPIAQKAAWRVPMRGIWNGGTATTAGNLVFQGNAEGKFVAYAADSGTPLWSFDAQAGIVGAPITYQSAGRQYVAVLAGYGGAGAAFGTLSAQFGWDARTQPRRLLTFVLDGHAALPPAPARVAPRPVADAGFVSDSAAEEKGGVSYAKNCFFCHGAGAIGGGSAPDLRASSALVSAEAFHHIVSEGALLTAGMPRFENLDEAELQSMRQYLRAQAAKLRAKPTSGALESNAPGSVP